MSATFANKSRKTRFELLLHVIDLNNVPLVSGTSFVKWHLPHSQAADHRGKTDKCVIRDHRVTYDYHVTIPVRLTVGKDGMLQECRIEFEILQEYSAGGKGERIRLGHIRANLAEYVEASELGPLSPGGTSLADADSEMGIVRRYLMQDSKINSTLKVGIYMKHVEGTRDFHAPPLRTAPVFGGIAGIMQSSDPAASTLHSVAGKSNADATEQDAGPMPSLSASNKEIGEMQDMYRRTIAAFWTSQPGELKADECIEDIFAGGNGWGKVLHADRTPTNSHLDPPSTGGAGSGTATPDPDSHGHRDSTTSSKLDLSLGNGIGAGHSKTRPRHERRTAKARGEIDEADVREDLKSWRVSTKVDA